MTSLSSLNNTGAAETAAEPPARWWRGPWGVAGLLAAVYCLLYSVWTFGHWGGEANVPIISDLAQIPMGLFAAVAALRTARTPNAGRATQRAWTLIGVALLASATGELLWFNYEIVQQTSPFPSWADLGYLLFYPIMLLGLLNLPYAPLSRSERVRLYLDTAILVVGSGIVIWLFILGPTASGFTPTLETILSAAYPVADLVVVFGLVYFLFRNPLASRRSGFGFLIGAMALFVIADVIFGIQSMHDAYVSGGPIDGLWVLSYLFFALAGLQQRASLTAHGNTFVMARQWAAIWLLPYVSLALACGLVLWQAAPLLAADPAALGSLIGLVLLVALISLRQILNLRENRRLAEELRLRVKQLDEAGTALSRAQHLAGIGTLAAGVAHEINNPLSVIITHVESLERRLKLGPVDEAYLRTALARIEKASWQGARIARSLLTYAHGADLRLTRSSAREILAEATMLVAIPPEEQIELSMTVGPDAPEVICDRGQIAQVLVNLIDNARDAITPPGKITVTADRDPAGGLSLKVSDTGSGMPPETLARAFDPFYTTKAIGEGTGLGLSICRGIVRAHDGEIEIDSRAGEGTRVTVHLPREPRPQTDSN